MSFYNGATQAPSLGRPSSSNSFRTRSSAAGKKDGVLGQAGWFSSVVNLVNTIVGAGVLAMPLAMSHMGMFLGTIVIAWAGLTAGFGLYLQTRCARYLDRGSASFFALSQMTYPKASVIFDAAIAIKCFGVGVSYLIIIGDLMPGVILGLNGEIDQHGFLMDRRFWITAFMLIVIPFSFLRRLDSLKYTSFIALISIGYLVVLVVAHCIMGDTRDQRGVVRGFAWQGPVATLSSLPVIVFAYTCHQNMFSILNEMNNPAPPKTTGVVTASIGLAAGIYALVAITGYLSFGDNVAGNIVGMYVASTASTIGKAAIVVLVMFSYALQVHPCRASVDAVLNYRPNRNRGRFASGSTPQPARPVDSMSEVRFAIITTVIIILSYIVAITVQSLETVLAYVGSTGSTSISFILPGLFYYKISAPDSPYHQRLLKGDDDEEGRNSSSGSEDEEDMPKSHANAGWRKTLLRRLSLALSIYGLVVMVTCLITNTFFIVAH